MFKIIQLLFNTYTYIASFVCSSLDSNENIHIENNINNTYKKIQHCPSLDSNENINIENNINNTYKKIQHYPSPLNKFQQCCWCDNFIDHNNSTLYLYMDKIYCTTNCRRSQIDQDYK